MDAELSRLLLVALTKHALVAIGSVDEAMAIQARWSVLLAMALLKGEGAGRSRVWFSERDTLLRTLRRTQCLLLSTKSSGAVFSQRFIFDFAHCRAVSKCFLCSLVCGPLCRHGHHATASARIVLAHSKMPADAPVAVDPGVPGINSTSN